MNNIVKIRRSYVQNLLELTSIDKLFPVNLINFRRNTITAECIFRIIILFHIKFVLSTSYAVNFFLSQSHFFEITFSSIIGQKFPFKC